MSPSDPASCPACGGGLLSAWLSRDSVPVSQNTLHGSRDAARDCPRGTLRMLHCGGCGSVHNAAFEPRLAAYGHGYELDQMGSPRYVAHLDEMAARLLESLPPGSPSVVLEIACGRGRFLERLAASPSWSRVERVLAFDPSFVPERAPALPARVEVRRAAFPPTGDDPALAGPIGAVVARHFVEHLPRPDALLASLARLLPGSAHRVFLETPDVDFCLGRRLVHDFYYEHCTLFSADGLRALLERTGHRDVEVTRVFGGEYLVAEALAPPSPARAPGDAATTHAPDRGERTPPWSASAVERALRLRFEALPRPVALWGGAGKGATFAAIVDPGGTLLDSVIDVNPAKHGSFVAGTGHAVRGPDAVKTRGIRAVVVANENYLDEITFALRRDGFPGTITTVARLVGAGDAPPR